MKNHINLNGAKHVVLSLLMVHILDTGTFCVNLETSPWTFSVCVFFHTSVHASDHWSQMTSSPPELCHNLV